MLHIKSEKPDASNITPKRILESLSGPMSYDEYLNYLMVKCPDSPIEDLRHYIKQQTDDYTEELAPDPDTSETEHPVNSTIEESSAKHSLPTVNASTLEEINLRHHKREVLLALKRLFDEKHENDSELITYRNYIPFDADLDDDAWKLRWNDYVERCYDQLHDDQLESEATIDRALREIFFEDYQKTKPKKTKRSTDLIPGNPSSMGMQEWMDHLNAVLAAALVHK